MQCRQRGNAWLTFLFQSTVKTYILNTKNQEVNAKWTNELGKQLQLLFDNASQTPSTSHCVSMGPTERSRMKKKMCIVSELNKFEIYLLAQICGVSLKAAVYKSMKFAVSSQGFLVGVVRAFSRFSLVCICFFS